MKPLPPAFSFERIMVSNAILMSQGKTSFWSKFEKKAFFQDDAFFSFPLTRLFKKKPTKQKTTVGMQLGSRAVIEASTYISFAVSQRITGLSIVTWEFIEGDIVYKLIKISSSEMSF